MGMHTKEGFRNLFTGTTVERVMRQGVKPVLMVKNKPVGEYKSVVVGTDFSMASHKAFRAAASLAPGASFSLVHAYELPHETFRRSEYAKDFVINAEEKQLDDFLKEEMKRFIDKAEEAPGTLSKSVVEGNPYEELMKEARKTKADLLVIGTHGQGNVVHAFLGGTAEQILTSPPCDVLVCGGISAS